MFSEKFTTGEYYHVYNRGVDKRNIFNSEDDFRRFVESLYVFNNRDTGSALSFKRRRRQSYSIDDQIVRIHLFALMPNHYHLLIKEIREGGISFFMQRLGTSYTKYINLKENRTGHLLESGFKTRHVQSQTHLEHLTRYIHLNPLDLLESGWKTNPIQNKTSTSTFLSSYQWSSFYYYYNSIESSFLDQSLLKNLFSSPQDHLHYMFQHNAFPKSNIYSIKS
ncbi:hypothetical protein COV05_02470 [Candidatus Uhrbacteria bacterium CG10_big_fil_rev_8_21_14_0_10_48_16]|uniref:Transposase IS200-like domain-containing protein n=1 Tax=Candidatus Uhrbacteria bacterium CG10_big_fil_rev_8_21_14_0_10_48_16 TaxID=1975038 RepID=A0A2M8LH88_9BACT|nr:MAG: hypothetical protein COV05_02470 [Candidatus Uhrbacteria bacterium CG10_big_fil_rev_8_21_14_0_10_48_16]